MKTPLITGITGQDGAYLTDRSNLIRIIQETQSAEIYNLSAQNHLQVSFETPPFYPRSPYAAAKLYAYLITVNYRESYGILFIHESPIRGEAVERF